MKTTLSLVVAAFLAQTALYAQEEGRKSVIKGLEVGVEYDIYSNVLDRGESLTNNNPTGVGAIALGYKGLGIEFATFGAGGVTEIDTSIGYTASITDALEISAAFLNISESDTDKSMVSDAGAEASLAIAYSIENVVDIGFDVMKDVKTNEFIIYQPSLAKAFGDLEVELLYGVVTSDDAANEFNYYHVGVSFPCAITTGTWGLAMANTDKEDNEAIYSISHSFSF